MLKGIVRGLIGGAVALVPAIAPAIAGAQTAPDAYKTGRAAFDAADYGAAIKAFERTVQLDEKNAEYHLWLARSVGMSAADANILRQPFLAKRAKAEFERTVALDRSNVPGREGLLQFYLRAPAIGGGSVTKARELAEESAKINGLRGHFARAAIANHDKEPAVAEREYRAALAGFPDSVPAYASLMSNLQQNGKSDDAFAVGEKLLARRPGDVAAQFAFVRLVAASGKRLDRGEPLARQLIALPPWTPDASLPTPAMLHFRLGEILAKKNDRDAARKEFEMALQLNPKLEAARRALKSL
jgi:tetratricopeptide (TPR) repeat protein